MVTTVPPVHSLAYTRRPIFLFPRVYMYTYIFTQTHKGKKVKKSGDEKKKYH
jgi:hypothetical protein